MHCVYSIAPTSLLHDARYEKMAAAFGADGYYAQTPSELRQSLAKALKQNQKPVLINVSIDPVAKKKPQVIKINIYSYVINFSVHICFPGKFLADKDKTVTLVYIFQ